MPDHLRAACDVRHIFSRNAVRREGHKAFPWLELAEGGLRLDRPSRNGVGPTFFLWAETHSSRSKNLSLSRIGHPEQLAAPIGRAASLSGSDFGHCGAATRPV
jgi:hypothetical protein